MKTVDDAYTIAEEVSQTLVKHELMPGDVVVVCAILSRMAIKQYPDMQQECVKLFSELLELPLKDSV